MEMTLLGIAIGVLLTGFVVAVVAIARAGSVGHAFWGLTIAGRAKQDPSFAMKLNEMLGLAPVSSDSAPVTKKISGEPLRLLTLLQAEARLIDFLMEDIHAAADAQIGQAVRDIHRKAQQTLKQHLVIESVLTGKEGESVTLATGFDPATISVIGNVTGQPPYTGEIQHPGYIVRDIKLPNLAAGQNALVLQPAEVQLP